jgi:hypothetical protein
MDRILITARHRREVNNSLILGNSIRVEIDGFTVQSHFAPCLREYDQNALNQIKRKGAIVNLKNHKKIQETLEALKAKYPGLPVQDNS